MIDKKDLLRPLILHFPAVWQRHCRIAKEVQELDQLFIVLILFVEQGRIRAYLLQYAN